MGAIITLTIASFILVSASGFAAEKLGITDTLLAIALKLVAFCIPVVIYAYLEKHKISRLIDR